MLDSFGEGFIAFDVDWRVTYCNRLGAAHYDLTPEDLIGRIAWTIPGMAEDEALREFLERARDAGAPVEAETPSEIQSERWYDLRAFPLQGGTGLSTRDVTERVEQARREREQAARLELALATAGFGDWRWDAATDMVDLSPRAAKMVGVPPGEVMTWTEQLDYLHPEDRERAQQAVVQALTDGTLYEIEYRFTRPADDQQRWMMVRGQGQYDTHGRPTGMHGVLTDITEQKAEAARIADDRARLAESEQRFRAMADSAPSPVWVTGEDGGLVFANRAFCDLAGMSLEQLQGHGWADILHPDDRGRVATLRAASRKMLAPNAWEGRFRIRGGEWRWMRTASSVRFDEAGVFRGYVGMAMDVTDTRRAEERQTLLINELNHRVKNTLATIQSLARQTLREGVSPRDARERLTDRLLALSAAHNVLTRENWEGADLEEIAREAVRPYDDTGGRIAACGPAARLAPNVALALSMALHELATNALKYGALSAPEGQVTLAWALAPAGDVIELAWREQGGPPVSEPTALGFGSRLLAGLAGELGAPADIRYDPTGLICRLRAPAA
jgi:PAS domain S-box-containing protein